jgi:phosphohistidine phosphatase
MKKLLLVRHAKSDWGQNDLSDFDRSLNHRGLNDAPMMAEFLKMKNIKPDLIISSAANRAITTASIIAEYLDYEPDLILQESSLYLCGANNILNNIKLIEDNIQTLMIVAHNPDITYLTNHLAGIRIDSIPTCGVACIDFNTDKWNEIDQDNAELIFFQYPKSIR